MSELDKGPLESDRDRQRLEERRRRPDYARGEDTEESEEILEDTRPDYARGLQRNPATERGRDTPHPDFARGQDTEEGEEEISHSHPDYSRGMHERKGDIKNE